MFCPSPQRLVWDSSMWHGLSVVCQWWVTAGEKGANCEAGNLNRWRFGLSPAGRWGGMGRQAAQLLPGLPCAAFGTSPHVTQQRLAQICYL